jgi:hypothetical protein
MLKGWKVFPGVAGMVGSAKGKLAAGWRANELLKTSIVPLAKSAA